MYENIETGESKFSSNESGKIRAFFFRYSFQMITFLPFFFVGKSTDETNDKYYRQNNNHFTHTHTRARVQHSGVACNKN